MKYGKIYKDGYSLCFNGSEVIHNKCKKTAEEKAEIILKTALEQGIKRIVLYSSDKNLVENWNKTDKIMQIISKGIACRFCLQTD